MTKTHITLPAALAFTACLLTTTAASAEQGEKIQPFECRQISGPAPSPLEVPELRLRTPGKILLVCPLHNAMYMYRVWFKDDDGYGGNSVVKTYVAEYTLNVPDTSTTRYLNTGGCSFNSNYTFNGNNEVGLSMCTLVVDPTSYAAIIVELWSRRAKPDVRFLGIETQ